MLKKSSVANIENTQYFTLRDSCGIVDGGKIFALLCIIGNISGIRVKLFDQFEGSKKVLTQRYADKFNEDDVVNLKDNETVTFWFPEFEDSCSRCVV